MDINAVITQLRQACPAFGGRVAGAADFAQSLRNQTNMALPACYVIPDGRTAGPNLMMNGIRQAVDEFVQIIFEVDMTAERTGQTAAQQLEALEDAVLAAVLNWRNTNDPKFSHIGLAFVDSKITGLDQGRMWYEMRFSRPITLTNADGFQLQGTPIKSIIATEPRGTTFGFTNPPD